MTNINKKNVLVSLISITWCIVSILAISLLTIFQAKANDDNDYTNMQFVPILNYSWIDNNAWVLKNLNFIKTWAINNIINSFYMMNNNIILRELDVMIPHPNNSGNAILWWIGNKTTSPNTTIIWWSYISSIWENTNFWWEGNSNEGEGTSIWWKDNIIYWNNIAVWWEANRASWNSNIIIWWNDINLWWNNIIAAWEKININNNNSDNSFIFNNDTEGFTPTTWNAFYINSQWGLWVNWEWSSNSTVIHWGISVWEIDITQWCRQENDIGIMWKANDCLVACTAYSLNNWWSLLENTDTCREWCRDESNCVEPLVIPEVEHDIFSGYCTWTIFTWATQCFSNFHPEKYQDVIFTNNYVNECPENEENLDNPCTYKCPDWYSFGDWTCKKNCVKTWSNGEEIIIPHWESINLYLEKTPYCNHNCKSESRTCNDWVLDPWHAQYIYLSCQIQIRPENQCSEDEYNIEENEKIAWWKYKACTWYTINWNSCTRHVKYKLQACDTGYTLSWWICHKNCVFNWISVPYWQTITWYKYQNSSCKDQNWFSCSNNKLLRCIEWWSLYPNPQDYPYTGCKLIWESCTGYTLTGCPFNWICSSCTWYTLNNNSCNQFIKYKLDNCSTWYTKVGDTCKSDCKTHRWENVKHGFPVVWYKNSSQYCPTWCEDPSNKRIMICNDGYLEWSWTYIYSWCTTKVLTWEWFGRTTKVSNAICEPLTWYSIQNNSCIEWSVKYKCTACKSWYTRNGQNWNWNNVKCLKDCSFTALPNNNTVYVNWSWWTITTYKSWYYECPELASNYSQIRVCNNGYLNGTFVYTPVTQASHICEIKNTDTLKTINKRLIEYESNATQIGAICEASTSNGTSCSETLYYYTYKCYTGYTRNNDNSNYKCIKCEWDIPQNAHANNNPSTDKPNGNNSITYYYNENNAACSFSCDDWFTRDENTNQCISNDKKCVFNGYTYNQWYQKVFYTENERICSNTCKAFTWQCRDGYRRDYTNNRIISWQNLYAWCHVVTGYVMSNSEPKSWLCPTDRTSAYLKIFTWNSNPNIANAILQWKCTNYSTRDQKTCKKWTTYYYYLCANGRSWNTCPSGCKRRNSIIESWQTLTLYDRVWEFQCPDSWNSQTITCKNWVRYSWNVVKNFNDGFDFIYGEYTLLWTHCGASWFNSLDKPTTWYYETCVDYGVENKTCEYKTTVYKVTTCPNWYTKVWNDCKQDCTLSGYWTTTIKVHYWDSITWYTPGILNCPGSCTSKKITCWENWQFNDTWYKYNNCIPVGMISCNSSEYPYVNPNDIPRNSSIEVCTWYKYNIGTHSCTQELRYKTGAGCQSWYTLVSGECKQDCSINWQKVTSYGDSITTYIPTDCPWPCHTWQLTCGDNWNFEWTRWMFSCQLLSKTCSSDFNRTNCPTHWICQTCTWYSTNSNTTNNKCITGNVKYKRIWCESGYTMDTVSNICGKDCSDPVFGEVQHRSEVTGRKVENWWCKSATKTCFNGQLNNSEYNQKNCTWCTTPRWQRIAAWQSATWYKQGTCRSSNSSCSYTGRKCIDWKRYLNNTIRNFPSDYTDDHCTMTAGESNWCTSDYNVLPSNKVTGWIYATWCTRYEYNWSSCVWNEYLKFMWCEPNYKEIDNQCFLWCTGFNKFYEHWSTVTWYITPVTCEDTSTECKYETRTCQNWKRKKADWSTWDFSWLSSTCTKLANKCEGYNLNSVSSSNEGCHYNACPLLEAWSCNDSWNKKYALASVDTWYFGTWNSCNSICGDWFSTPCNRPYTATWLARQLPNNIRVNTRWHWYICNKNYNSVKWVDTYQCNCPNNTWWNGSRCSFGNNSPCGDKDECIDSHRIQWNVTNGGKWYERICWIEGRQETCTICNEWYTWTNCDKVCEWTKPQWEWIVTSPRDTVSYYNGSPVGYLSWTYEQNPSTATSISCSWSCQDWYTKNPNWDSCIKPCGQSCLWMKPSWDWVLLWSSIVSCNPDGSIMWNLWWTYITNPSAVSSACCLWSCKDGYTRNGNTCVKTSPCWDSDDYGKSPWLHKDKLCADGWSVVTQSTSNAFAPTISWNLEGNICKPLFTWYCKKSGKNPEKCTEESLNTAYVKTIIERMGNVYYDGKLYSDYGGNSELTTADDINVTMYYYNSIYDGNYNGQNLCQLPPTRETTQLPVEEDNLPAPGSAGWKIESFRYNPITYTVGNTSYILTPIRWQNWEFLDYVCNLVNGGAILKIFHCSLPIQIQVQ